MHIPIENYELLQDEELQALCAAGDGRAEELLSERYTFLVRACARPYYLVGGDHEDLTQEGMLGLLTAIRSYNAERAASFRTYAELCIRSRLLSAVRKAGSKKQAPLNEGISLEAILNAEQTTQADVFYRMPEEQVLARESITELFNHIDRLLSPAERLILPLFLDGLSYRAIAERCGKDVKSVDNAVQRIRRKLARHIISGDFSAS